MPEFELTAAEMFANAARFTDAYHVAIQPLCEKTHLPSLAVDILMFLANNPGRETAREICRYRGLKPGIVSFHVDRLVQEGYLERGSVLGDRRKTALRCTPKAAGVIEEGRRLQRSFALRLTEGMTAEDLAHFRRCIRIFDANITRIQRSGKSPERHRNNEGADEEA